MFITKTYNVSGFSVGFNSRSLNISVDGYTPITTVGYQVNNSGISNLYGININLSAKTLFLQVDVASYNYSSAWGLTITVLYVKSNYCQVNNLTK